MPNYYAVNLALQHQWEDVLRTALQENFEDGTQVQKNAYSRALRFLKHLPSEYWTPCELPVEGDKGDAWNSLMDVVKQHCNVTFEELLAHQFKCPVHFGNNEEADQTVHLMRINSVITLKQGSRLLIV